MATTVTGAGGEGITLEAAAAVFLAERDLAVGSRAKYRATLATLVDELGAGRALAAIGSRELVAAFARRWPTVAPNTWNRHVATVRSLYAFAIRQGWAAWGSDPTTALERRRIPDDETRAIPTAALEALWARRNVALRERALWRLLYESAARASEVLALDVDDLDLENRQAVIVGKGGHRELLHYQTGAARLLAQLTAGRAGGPVFLARRRPGLTRTPPVADRCPETGRARLSYRRAAEQFTAATGRTLHQLRHSALTDLAAANVSLPLLMAKSRHRSLRSLQRYARPGPDAVAALTAQLDPAGRRRW